MELWNNTTSKDTRKWIKKTKCYCHMSFNGWWNLHGERRYTHLTCTNVVMRRRQLGTDIDIDVPVQSSCRHAMQCFWIVIYPVLSRCSHIIVHHNKHHATHHNWTVDVLESVAVVQRGYTCVTDWLAPNNIQTVSTKAQVISTYTVSYTHHTQPTKRIV